MKGFKLLSLATVFMAVFTVSGFAQNLEKEIDSLKLKPRLLMKFGKQAEKMRDYYSAIDYYKKYLEQKPDKFLLYEKLGDLYFASRDYVSAKEWYQKAYESDKDQNAKSLYKAGLMYKMSDGDYDKAKSTFEEFKEEHKTIAGQKEFKKIFESDLNGCDVSKKLLANELKTLIIHLDTSINMPHTEFSPIIYNDSTLIYASMKLNKVEYYSTTDKQVKRPVRKFYTAKKNQEDWVHKGELEGPFNSDEFQTGNGVFSADKQRFYFTRCETNDKYKTICSIYKSFIDSTGKWTEPEMLEDGINDPEYTTTQPTVGFDKNKGYEILYFVSDRDGTKGGMDLWYAIYDMKKGTWKSPKNAGSKINSMGDDITPFYDQETKTMYFSSNAWPGMGGFDIFKASGEVSKWAEPVNYGSPINSKVDEIYFVQHKNQEEGFFVSNREGGNSIKHQTCCDDIYHFRLLNYIKIYLKGELLEGEDSLKAHSHDNVKVPVADAAVNLYLVDKTSGQKMLIRSEKSDAKGLYNIRIEQGNDYEIEFDKPGYFPQRFDLSTKDIVKSDTIPQDARFMQKMPAHPVVVKNIYYPYDKYYLTPESKVVVDTTIYKFLVENPTIIVEISSHTDSNGNDQYNETLSQNRAESVVKYLIEKGVSKDRLQAKGYGETKPLVPNTKADGSDDPEGRAHNRRTEFKILGVIKDATDILYEE